MPARPPAPAALLALLALLALATLAGCGGAGDDVGSGPATAPTRLEVEVVAGPGGEARRGTLSCGDGPASGTGFLADLAEAACEAVAGEDARRRLVEGPARDQACTQQYGGPEVATVTGTLEGRPVDTRFDRTDGCGIADWQLLVALLGEPSGPPG